MIPITQEESFLIRKLAPSTYITGVNKEHMSKSKGYFMTCTRTGVKLLSKCNIKAREEYLDMLDNDLLSYQKKLKEAQDNKNKEDKTALILGLNKKIKQVEKEIQELKALDI